MSTTTTRVGAIRDALTAGRESGTISDWYCYAPGDRRGRRWVVWGAAVGAYEYRDRDAGDGSGWGSVERAYSTRDVESMLRHAGLL